MAVSSLNNTLFRCCTTLGSPFITASSDARAYPRLLGLRQRAVALGAHFAQHAARAFATPSAARADAQLEGDLVERLGSRPGALFQLALRYRVADADIQEFLRNNNYYHLIRDQDAMSEYSLTN